MMLFCEISIRREQYPLAVRRVDRVIIFAHPLTQLLRLATLRWAEQDLVPARLLQYDRKLAAIGGPRGRVHCPCASRIVFRSVKVDRGVRSTCGLIKSEYLQLSREELARPLCIGNPCAIG